MTGTDTTIKARRGDLAVIERRNSTAVWNGHTTRSYAYDVVLVTSVTRAGEVKAVREIQWGDDVAVQPIARIVGLESVRTISKDIVNVPEVIAHVRTHTYPNSVTPMPYESLQAVREAIRPFRTDVTPVEATRGMVITTSVERREIFPGFVIDVEWFNPTCSCGYKPGVGYTSRARAESLREIHGRDCDHCG